MDDDRYEPLAHVTSWARAINYCSKPFDWRGHWWWSQPEVLAAEGIGLFLRMSDKAEEWRKEFYAQKEFRAGFHNLCAGIYAAGLFWIQHWMPIPKPVGNDLGPWLNWTGMKKWLEERMPREYRKWIKMVPDWRAGEGPMPEGGENG